MCAPSFFVVVRDTSNDSLHRENLRYSPDVRASRLQDFPYACEPGIQHHNIWCTKALGQKEIDAVVAKHRPAAEGWQVLTFVNPVELQSIRAVRRILSVARSMSCVALCRIVTARVPERISKAQHHRHLRECDATNPHGTMTPSIHALLMYVPQC
jgi:hypothetical protein